MDIESSDDVREEMHYLIIMLLRKSNWNHLPKKLPLLSQLIVEELQSPKSRSQTLKFLLEFVAGKTLSVPPKSEKKPTKLTVVFDDADEPEDQDQVQAKLPASA